VAITINIPPFLNHLTDGIKAVDVAGTTVGECLKCLVKRLPSVEEHLLDADGKLLRSVEVYVNGKSTYPEELAKPVQDDDRLDILLALAGG
jgi:sulfur-carrier protein